MLAVRWIGFHDEKEGAPGVLSGVPAPFNALDRCAVKSIDVV